jgi:hypothetical protein
MGRVISCAPGAEHHVLGAVLPFVRALLCRARRVYVQPVRANVVSSESMVQKRHSAFALAGGDENYCGL